MFFWPLGDGGGVDGHCSSNISGCRHYRAVYKGGRGAIGRPKQVSANTLFPIVSKLRALFDRRMKVQSGYCRTGTSLAA